MPLTATISYPYDERVLQLFSAESKTFPKTQYSIKRVEDSLVFSVTADDATALRAALTTITKVLSVWESSELHER